MGTSRVPGRGSTASLLTPNSGWLGLQSSLQKPPPGFHIVPEIDPSAKRHAQSGHSQEMVAG